ncbi:SRL1 [Scenedesmus sp. PABB004]|nr:SRL1 [Scenedesmus sp. PABB004]
MEQYGNTTTFNLESVLMQNIVRADFYKTDCAALTSWAAVVDQIYFQVDYVEPWLAGNARGPSTAFCLLHRLFTLKPTEEEVRETIDHADSPYIRAVGFLYLRYVADPRSLWSWMGPYVDDKEELQPSGPNGPTVTIGDFVRDLLLEQYYFETIFPRIPKRVEDEIQAGLRARGLPTKGAGNGGAGGPDRRGGEAANARPASVKASLSVAFGQRAPNRAGTKDPSRAGGKALEATGAGGGGGGGGRGDRGGDRVASRSRSASRDRRHNGGAATPERGHQRGGGGGRGEYGRERERERVYDSRRGYERDRGYDSRDRDRGADRDRERERGYDRDRDRDRERERGYDRDWERERERGYDRDRERERERARGESRGWGARSRSRSRSRERSRDRGGGGGRDARDVFKDRAFAPGGAPGGDVRSRYGDASGRLELGPDAGRRPASELEDGPQLEASLDEQFATVLYALMNDEIGASSAITGFEKASAGMMQQYREASSALLHRAAHYLHTRRLAAELEGQAASWALLASLYCCGDAPAGSGLAGAADVGGQQTLRQLSAEVVNGDSIMRRCAQVVCWLESLAAQRLQDAPGARFALHEGLWRETLLTTGTGTGAGGAAELDPDAPGRGKVKLALGDRQGEERLAAQLWALLRAGKLREGRQLCCQAGQAWRCLSLAGGGEWGPLPVGAAALEAAEGLDQQAAAEELAWQVEGGLAASRVAWKWACFAAAEAAATATPGNRWEAAVYAALCGHVARMLPVCASWEDEAWAYCRAWLDLQTDAMLSEDVEQGVPGAHEALFGGSEEDMVSPELLAGAVAQAARSGYSAATDAAALREGLAAVAGAWPLQRLLGEGDRLHVPRNFDDLLSLLTNSANAAVRADARGQQRGLQLLLMAEDWQGLALQLAEAAVGAAEQLDAAAGAGAGDGEGGDAEMLHEGGADEGARMSAESAASVLRFAAHWALCLRALGLLPDHTWLADEAEEADVARLQTMLGRVVHAYARHLTRTPSTLRLAPLYLCHLRLGLRESLAGELLAAATDCGDDDACQALYVQLATTTAAWAARQERLADLVLSGARQPGPYWEAEAGGDDGEEGGDDGPQPSSCLFGDLRPEELRLLLQHLTARAFASSAESPLSRCRQLRWQFYAFTSALAEAQAPAAPGAGGDEPGGVLSRLGWQPNWGDALAGAVALASELALNPRLGSAGLAALLGQVVPPEFLEAAGAALGRGALPRDDPPAALCVSRQLLALSFWARYAELDARYAAWRDDWAAALCGASGAAGVAAAAEQGGALVAALLGLAREDALRLPAPPGLAALLAGGGGDGGTGVQDGEWLCLPKHDDAADTPTELVLALSVARGHGGDGEAAGADDPDQPFLQLNERDAARLAQQVSAFLAAAAPGAPDVRAEVSPAEPGSDAGGCVLVRLASFGGAAEPDAPDAEHARLGRRMTAAWADMASLAARLLSAGGRGGAGDDGGLPRLSLVSLGASLSTRLALCRHRTTSKLLRRSAKVLLELARAGHPSPQLDRLVLAAGDAAGRDGPGLLALLSPGDAGKLLARLELAMEEGGLLEEAAA